MKRGDIIGLVIVVIIIIGVIVWIATDSEDDEPTTASQDDKVSIRPGFLERLANRCETIQREIDNQLEKLRLTIEMQQAADRLGDQLKLAAKVFLAIFVTGVLCSFVYTGIGIWTAILTLSAFVGVVIPVLTFFFFKNVMTLEALINWFFVNMQKVIYKRYGCDPATIKSMQQSIIVKQEIVSGLKDELKREA